MRRLPDLQRSLPETDREVELFFCWKLEDFLYCLNE